MKSAWIRRTKKGPGLLYKNEAMPGSMSGPGRSPVPPFQIPGL